MTYNSDHAAAAVALAMAAAAVSILLTKAKVTRKFRMWISARSEFAKGLFKCPYCMGHWWIFPGAFYFEVRVVRGPYPWVDVLVSGFAMVFMATIMEGLMILALSIMDSRHKQEEAPQEPKKGDTDGEAS